MSIFYKIASCILLIFALIFAAGNDGLRDFCAIVILGIETDCRNNIDYGHWGQDAGHCISLVPQGFKTLGYAKGGLAAVDDAKFWAAPGQ